MQIVITGGAGFIGSEFVRALLKNQYKDYGLEPSRVTVVDSLTYAGNLVNLKDVSSDPRYEFVRGTITSESLMNEVTQNCDLLINFAAESHVDRSITDPSKFVSTNIQGVQTILESAKKNSIGRVIQVSTDEVYGSVETGSWTEKSSLMPNSPYSASKASADMITRAYHKTYGLDTITTRCVNNFGPFQNPEKFLPVIITSLIQNRDIPVYGNGLNVREWISVNEHTKAIAFLATNGAAGEIYNIGGQNSYTNLDLIKKVMTIFGTHSSNLNWVSDRLGHDFRYSLDDSKILQLGFLLEKNFDNELKNTIDWYKSNMDWWMAKK